MRVTMDSGNRDEEGEAGDIDPEDTDGECEAGDTDPEDVDADHLDDIEDGIGCVEVWEALSEQREASD